jgi:hypothetical protein
LTLKKFELLWITWADSEFVISNITFTWRLSLVCGLELCWRMVVITCSVLGDEQQTSWRCTHKLFHECDGLVWIATRALLLCCLASGFKGAPGGSIDQDTSRLLCLLVLTFSHPPSLGLWTRIDHILVPSWGCLYGIGCKWRHYELPPLSALAAGKLRTGDFYNFCVDEVRLAHQKPAPRIWWEAMAQIHCGIIILMPISQSA